MNLQSLVCFIAVAECGGFSSAAQKLYISQPAISHQIRVLEETLNVSLFERGNTSVELTDIGRICLPLARNVISGCEQLSAAAERYRGMASGRLLIGYANDKAGEVALPALRKMVDSYPELDIHARYIRVVPAIAALRNRELDMIVTSQQSVKCLKDIETVVILRCGLMAIFPDGHPMAKKKSVRFADIAGEKVFIKHREYFPEEYDAFWQDVKENGAAFLDVREENTTEDVFTQVQLGRGISLLGGGLLRQRVSGICAVPVEDSRMEHGIVAAWRRGEQKLAVREMARLFAQSRVVR